MSLDNFVCVDGTKEIVDGQARMVDAIAGAAQQYNQNNGILAFVRDFFVHIGKDTPENLQPLLDLGYKKGTFRVPHSNDGGKFLDELLALKKKIESEPPKEGFHPISIEVLKRLPDDKKVLYTKKFE